MVLAKSTIYYQISPEWLKSLKIYNKKTNILIFTKYFLSCDSWNIYTTYIQLNKKHKLWENENKHSIDGSFRARGKHASLSFFKSFSSI